MQGKVGKLCQGVGRIWLPEPGIQLPEAHTALHGGGRITHEGRQLADLIVRGESPYEKLFNPSRFKPAAGFSSFVKENATVVHDMIADKLSIERIKSLSDIPAGEARVVKLDGDSYAVYREKEGRVHLLKSTCPHAKCEVRWNKAELSWDCPCHGSRFNINGRLLNAPATIELQRFDTDELT